MLIRPRPLVLSLVAVGLLPNLGLHGADDPTRCRTLPGAALAAPGVAAPMLAAGPAGAASAASLALTELVRSNPILLPELALDRYEAQVREYRCTFYKQERIRGRLGKVEEIDVRFREQPYSVYMTWRRNADEARRALFIDSPEFVDGKGRKVAKVEPAGAVLRLFVSQAKVPIHGLRSRKASRRAIDAFGFKEILQLLVHYNTLAAHNGVLDYRYSGTGEVDGRPTFVFTRFLPFRGEGDIYPDAKLVIHLDQEWLLPTALYSYADREGKVLLGSYVFTDVQLNPGFTPDDFRF